MENNVPVKTPTVFYFLGLLCLIPLLGGLVGLGLLLYGIIVYKDKWLLIVGAFGIVFSVVVYSVLFYEVRYGETFQNGFVTISQMELSNLVKSVEFYKIQHGQYPDNLNQLTDEDKFAPINDPIQLNQGRVNTYYQYEKAGQKYMLFSAGQDGIPHTNDDLFPKVIITDSSKIGLIIPKEQFQ